MHNDMKLIGYLQRGMQAEGLRQKAISNNVANMATPGFRRSGVRFEELLAEKLDRNKMPDADDVEMEVYQPENTPVNSMGNDVAMDVEVGEMIKNTLRHKTFMSLIKKKYQQFDAAMNVR